MSPTATAVTATTTRRAGTPNEHPAVGRSILSISNGGTTS